MPWLTPEVTLLLASAASIGFVHTLVGPDHYLPFVALARDRGWSRTKTLGVTALCGLGHCAGSVVLGLVGIAFGLGLAGLESTEAMRGNLAAWVLLGLAIAYFAWSVRTWQRGKVHSHRHVHADGTVHSHPHGHGNEHAHAHAPASAGPLIGALFIIFVLGPCEALIPVLMYPAANLNWTAAIAVALVFSAATVMTMLAAVWIGLTGAKRFALRLAPGASGMIAATLIGACAAAMLLGL